MLSDYFTGIEKADIYAMVGFFIFFIFFIAVTIHTIRLNKKETNELGKIPLDDGTIDSETDLNSK
ncbi:MAG TPA: hypothetical protein VKA10_10840 [Prolixibacteraceae bacterium]|nr:hypothetical protein [Prolixibacteraceae bacterium]